MKCPLCGFGESKVTDSRCVPDNHAIRRRRECLGCGERFTTLETVDISLQVRKRDGSYEDFDLQKLIKGIRSASKHTSISYDQVCALATAIATQLTKHQIRSIDAVAIGELVMERLRPLDQVAYIRFACVYRRFKDVDAIRDAIETIAPEEEGRKEPLDLG